MTLSIDIDAIKLILCNAAAVHGLTVSVEAIDMARLALKSLGFVGKGVERDRRPSEEELERLIGHIDEKPRQTIPTGAVIQFAVATAMRQEEIFKVVWDDYAARTKMLTIRDRKDPREKTGNDRRIPLLSVSGFDPAALIEGQRRSRLNADLRIFLFNHRSASTAFTRACKALGIADLLFHDLRHEEISRLFEAGFQIQQVELVTGRKDWKMLRRYTHLRPEPLHLIPARLAVHIPAASCTPVAITASVGRQLSIAVSFAIELIVSVRRQHCARS